MASPDRPTTIIAIIPHHEKADVHVRDMDGNFPSATHEHGTGTHESTFRAIGQRVLGANVSVQRRAYDHEKELGHITYEAKPIAAEFDPDSPYQWR